MGRYGKFFGVLAIGMAVALSVADMAEARKASGGFGSRGTRTFSAPPATRTAPAPAAPIQRTMTPNTGASQSQPSTVQTRQQNAQRPGMFGGLLGGIGGGLLGGLLMGGLFGMLMGSGFGGGFGFLGLLLQAAVIFFVIRFAMRMFANRQPALSGAGGMARDTQPSRPSFEIPRMGGGAASAAPTASRNGSPDEIGIGQSDLERFEGLLQEMQAAYAAEDYSALRRITTPEAMSYLAEELSENATRGVKNEVRDVHLVQGDVAESWREGNVEYATVAMRYESIDVLRDRNNGSVVSGDPDHPSESTEIWTFVRRAGTDWQISAIQAVGDPE